ncbi:MAG: hypothetical protein K2X35_08125 [Bryobacteraceae bacterium]|nr:hypothetical protein [Bryobacteraceae bacterium]
MIARIFWIAVLAAPVLPAAMAYLDASGRLMYRAGIATRIVETRRTYEPCLSPDSRWLVYARDEPGTNRAIVRYDAENRRNVDLRVGLARSPKLSPDGSRIAYLELVDRKWQVWLMDPASPKDAAPLWTGNIATLHGWTPDGRSVLAMDDKTLLWISPEGRPARSIAIAEVYGPELQWMSSDRVRVHPHNPDVALLSAYYRQTPKGAPADEMELLSGVFVVNLKAKTRRPVTGAEVFGGAAEWSPEGDEIYFTRREPSGRKAVYATPANGVGMRRVIAGSEAVVSSQAELFRGFYVFHSRQNTFQPCGSKDVLWVRARAETLVRLESGYHEHAGPSGSVYVEMRGFRREKAADGFAAQFAGQFFVTDLMTLRARQPGDCR